MMVNMLSLCYSKCGGGHGAASKAMMKVMSQGPGSHEVVGEISKTLRSFTCNCLLLHERKE